ncbi:MAG: SRPBCC family protein [Gammaproteobacteria bacterium]|nr:SRPBCC family protein [Gammaproteobacteria bacterium]
MVVVSHHIHIDTPVDRVFALMVNPAARAALNPFVTPIRIETEDHQPLHLGSVCHFRLQTGDRIVNYRTRVHEFEPNRCIVSVSDSAVAFEIRIETHPESNGTRLTHVESFEPSQEMLSELGKSERGCWLMRVLAPLMAFIDTDYALRVRRRQEELLEQQLVANLERWLEAIRAHLERH